MQILRCILLVLATTAATSSAVDNSHSSTEPIPDVPDDTTSPGLLDIYYHLQCDGTYSWIQCHRAGWYCTDDGFVDNVESDDLPECEDDCICRAVMPPPRPWIPCDIDPSRCQ